MPPLDEVQLAALDLLIAYQKSGSAPHPDFVNISVNNLGDVAAAAGAVAVVAAATAAVAATSATVSAGGAGGGSSLQELMDIRDRAIQAQSKP